MQKYERDTVFLTTLSYYHVTKANSSIDAGYTDKSKSHFTYELMNRTDQQKLG